MLGYAPAMQPRSLVLDYPARVAVDLSLYLAPLLLDIGDTHHADLNTLVSKL